MREVKSDDRVLARHICASELGAGLNFFSGDDEFIQVGAWTYDSGKQLQAHIHNKVERNISHTCEVLYVISGSLLASIYNEAQMLIDTINVRSGDILVLLDGGHGYRILDNKTRVLEVKNGPYPGAELDRRRF